MRVFPFHRHAIPPWSCSFITRFVGLTLHDYCIISVCAQCLFPSIFAISGLAITAFWAKNTAASACAAGTSCIGCLHIILSTGMLLARGNMCVTSIEMTQPLQHHLHPQKHHLPIKWYQLMICVSSTVAHPCLFRVDNSSPSLSRTLPTTSSPSARRATSPWLQPTSCYRRVLPSSRTRVVGAQRRSNTQQVHTLRIPTLLIGRSLTPFPYRNTC
jgi:hypothetical protein